MRKLVLALCLLAMQALAGQLTPVQLAALKADINIDPILSVLPLNSDTAAFIAEQYNLTASPDYWVWKTALTRKEVVESTSLDPDGVTPRTFNWTGNGFITRSQGERDAWREMWNHSGAVNPSLPSIRQAFQDIFSGAAAPAPSNRQHLLNVARKRATRAEKLFATGTGTAATPGVMSFEGLLQYPDVVEARQLP
jgi:hypothetical protein